MVPVAPMWVAYLVLVLLCAGIGIIYAARKRGDDLAFNQQLDSFQVALGRSRPVGWDRFWGTAVVATIYVGSGVLLLITVDFAIRGV